jgi:hypothetical protein
MRLSDNMEVNASVVPLFTGGNWDEFEFKMRNLLEFKELWEAIEYDEDSEVSQAMKETEKEIMRKKNTKAKSFIVMHVDARYIEQVRGLTSARQVWEKLNNLFKNQSMNQVINLRDELNKMIMSEEDDMIEYFGKLEGIQRKLNGTAAPVTDEELIVRLIGSLPQSWDSFIQGLRSSANVLEKYETVKSAIIQENIARKYKNVIKTEGEGKAKGSAFNTDAKSFKGECHNCGKKGHKKEQCWAKGGGQEGKGPKGGRKRHEKQSGTGAISWAFSSGTNATSNEQWILDSGASDHMSNRIELFENFKKIEKEIMVANREMMNATGMGNINFVAITEKGTVNIQLRDVLYVEKIGMNLVSAAKLDSKGYRISISTGKLSVTSGRETLLEGTRTKNNMFMLRMSPKVKSGKSLFAGERVSLMDIHARMGHLNYSDIKKLRITNLVDDRKDCEVCALAKSHSMPFKSKEPKVKVEEYGVEVGEMVHSDYCGPMEEKSITGHIGFWTYIDEKSRKCNVYLKESGGNGPKQSDCLAHYLSWSKTQTGNRVKWLKCDNAKEYLSKESLDTCNSKGVEIDSSNPYKPQQNGRAERMNRTLVEMARSMLIQAGMGKEYWSYAIMAAAHVRNRCPTRRNYNGKTPEEVWSGRKVDISYIMPFGSICYPLVPKEKRKKFDPTSTKCRLVGYTRNGYILEAQDGRIVYSRDVKFIEPAEETIIHDDWRVNEDYEQEEEDKDKDIREDLQKSGSLRIGKEDELEKEGEKKDKGTNEPKGGKKNETSYSDEEGSTSSSSGSDYESCVDETEVNEVVEPRRSTRQKSYANAIIRKQTDIPSSYREAINSAEIG